MILVRAIYEVAELLAQRAGTSSPGRCSGRCAT